MPAPTQPTIHSSWYAARSALVFEDETGAAKDVRTNQPLPVGFPDGSYDAFSRVRVSNPVTLFNSQSEYDAGLEDVWNHATTTGGTATAHCNIHWTEIK